MKLIYKWSKFNLIELKLIWSPHHFVYSTLITFGRYIMNAYGYFQQYSMISWQSTFLVFQNCSIAREPRIYHKKLMNFITTHANRTLIETNCMCRCKSYHHAIVFTISLCSRMSCLFLWSYAFLLLLTFCILYSKFDMHFI